VLLWLASEVRVDGFMPKLLDAIPVLDEPTLENLTKIMGLLVGPGSISNIEV
jgi:hypothetical protein